MRACPPLSGGGLRCAHARARTRGPTVADLSVWHDRSQTAPHLGNGFSLARGRHELFLPVPDHDHLHDLVVDVGMRHRRAFDEQAVALETDETGLLAAD